MNALNETARYMFGLTNIQSAVQRMTEPVSYKVVQTPGEANLIGYIPNAIDRLRNASGEMTILAGKLTVNAVYLTGGVVAGLEATGAISPNGVLSAAGFAKNFFNATNTVVANGIYYGANVIYLSAKYVACPIAEHVVLPGTSLLAKTALSHPVNAVIGVAVPALLYSGSRDLIRANSTASQQVHIRGTSVGIKEVPQRPFTARVSDAVSGVGKIAAAMGLTVLAVNLNS